MKFVDADVRRATQPPTWSRPPVVELHRISYTDDRPIEDFCSSMAGGNSHVFAYEFDAPE